MSVNKKVITWTQFEICNSDKRNAFESIDVYKRQSLSNSLLVSFINSSNNM